MNLCSSAFSTLSWLPQFQQHLVLHGLHVREHIHGLHLFDTVRHIDAREVGAEWLCKQALEIYRKPGYKEAPFKKMKICRSQRPPD